jgi:hypothetical protein
VVRSSEGKRSSVHEQTNYAAAKRGTLQRSEQCTQSERAIKQNAMARSSAQLAAGTRIGRKCKAISGGDECFEDARL